MLQERSPGRASSMPTQILPSRIPTRAGRAPVPTGTVRRGLTEFRILGPLEVVGDRGTVRLGGTRQRATLAILLLNANRVVSVDRIVEDLYADAAPVTALKQVQRQISELRKALGAASVIETRTPGYLIRLSSGQLDLSVFEQLAEEAAEALAAGDPRKAADLLGRALRLWRGDPLSDLTYESFAQASIERLHEIHLAALEQRIEADLALGRHTELIAELEQLVDQHPVREQFHAQLMLALYRSARQAEALAAYREARAKLMDGFGIEPSRGLKELERRILGQDPRLELIPDESSRPASPARSPRTVLAVANNEADVERLAKLAEPLTSLPEQELILARLVASEPELPDAVSSLEKARQAAETTRVAAFTSVEPARDVIRLASAYDVELVLVDAPTETHSRLPDDIVAVLEESPADVGLVVGPPVDWDREDGIFVPFGGTEHDWAALEVGTWLASNGGAPLRLVGVRADPARGRRDASRLLANASLAVQRLVDISAQPLLVDSTPDALTAAVKSATLVVVGLSLRWRTEGIGAARGALLRAGRPVVLVHAGPRPSGLAPRDARTRFSWSLAG
jgi:DNA-binding SARP family transcriptional activator